MDKKIAAGFAGLVLTGLAAANAAPPAAPASGPEADKKSFALTCAAFYRWQGGSQDPSTIRAYEYIKALDAGFPPDKLFRAIGYARDGVQEDLTAGKATQADVARTLKTCAEKMGIPAPAGPLRASAFPEPIDQSWATKVRLCGASYLWQAGMGEGVKLETALLARAIHDSPEAAAAQVKRGADNIQKALDGGQLSHGDLTQALSECPGNTDIPAPSGPLRERGLGYEQKPAAAIASAPAAPPAEQPPALKLPGALSATKPGVQQ